MSFATRVAALFGVFLAMFAMLGMRLWFVQVAEGAEAAEVTESQSWVYVSTLAPRGDIRDRDGELLVTSRFVPAVVVDRHLVLPDQRDQLIQRLSSVLAIPADEIAIAYDLAGVNGRFTVADVGVGQAYTINEQLRDLPGVRIEKVPQRVYLTGQEMAHVIGHLGLPTKDDLDLDPDLDPNTRIGKLGVERAYDEYLRGTEGEIAFRVREGVVIEEQPDVAPIQGDTVQLTLSLEIQQVVSRALQDGIALSNEWKEDRRKQGLDANNETVRGAAVVMDVKTGAILAMDSYPHFDPALFVGGLDTETYNLLAEQRAFLNLAVSGLYPPASTFKAVTYMAMLENSIPFPTDVEGVDATNRRVHCDGSLELPGLSDGSPQIFKDWYTGDKGWLDYHAALEQSCNIFFYSVALGVHRNWKGTAQETVIQDEARALGYGSKTGIDLVGEANGIIPDRELFKSWQELQRENEDAPTLLDPSRLELADPWFGGDLMNTAIGQGAVSATPLQVAVSYAALASGGKVWKPYVVSQIRNVDDALVYVGRPELVRDLAFTPEHTQSFLTDLGRVVSRGTAASAFSDFGPSKSLVGGKTGTGQSLATRDNHAWFAGVAPLDDPQYVVVVLIDEGGSGGAVAAPVARYILQYLMGEELTPIVAGAVAD